MAFHTHAHILVHTQARHTKGTEKTVQLVRVMGFNGGAVKDKIHVIDCHRKCVHVSV